MRYEGAVYRPPSEARSLIVQVTLGCAHNTCTFCKMYKDKSFRIRPVEDIVAELEDARRQYAYVERFFLADGDALVLKEAHLVTLLETIRRLFPECQRIGIYATPQDILRKGLDALCRLKEAGIGIAYMGIESGDDDVLKSVHKGVTAEQMIAAGQLMKQAGIPLSVTLISGLGGRSGMRKHAERSARVVSEINPEYASFLTLMVEPGTPLYDDYARGAFELLTPEEVMWEMQRFLECVDAEGCVFRANHASNYVSLAGTLNRDRRKLIDTIEAALRDADFKPEYWRQL